MESFIYKSYIHNIYKSNWILYDLHNLIVVNMFRIFQNDFQDVISAWLNSTLTNNKAKVVSVRSIYSYIAVQETIDVVEVIKRNR